MNIPIPAIKEIKRVIAHTIYPKTETQDARVKHSNKLLTLDTEEKNILIDRLTQALGNSTKTFQLEFEDKNEYSFYEVLKSYQKLDDDQFIKVSKKLATRLTAAHFRINIPGGYCLLGDGLTKQNKPFTFVIKAELQEVFSIQGEKLKLIKNVFLSPAKDFYKIGFFYKESSEYVPFMYDDQFSLQKRDLTEYFYSNFLGLTTDKNDRLKSKNFYEMTKDFIDKNITNYHDKIGLMETLKVLYRENTSGIISAKDFSNTYLEGDLKDKFNSKIVEKYFPISFTKDDFFIENKLELQRISIPLSYEISLVGSVRNLSNVEIIDNPTNNNILELEPQINNGSIDQLIILRNNAI